MASSVIKAKFAGRAELSRQLNAIAPGFAAKVGKTALRHARKVATVAASRAPVRTGKYRASIHAAMLSEKPQKDVSRSAFSRTKDPYAAGVFGHFRWRWLEFGTVKMRAQPHIMPSYRAQKPYFKRAMRTALRKAIKEATSGQAPSTEAPAEAA